MEATMIANNGSERAQPVPALGASPAVRRLVWLAREFLPRLGACAAEYVFAYAAIVAYINDPSRITLLVMTVSGVFTIGALILARAAVRVDWHPLAIAVLPVIYGYQALLSVDPGPHLLPEWIATSIQLVALLWIFYAKLSLGRSFGLLPANRGIVMTGAYRWVRHPIYVGYIVVHIGFLAASFSWRNLLVLTIAHLVQIYRLLREEALLSDFESYQDYRRSVRYRLIPGVF
jgi:protein-S-isoprenylcysteine O-methyltransferase Ste14